MLQALPSPPLDGFAIPPVSSSTPRDDAAVPVDSGVAARITSGARTNGEVTVNEPIAGNTRTTSNDQTSEKHSQSGTDVILNGDISSHKRSTSPKCEPEGFCNGDVTLSKDSQGLDFADVTLTNDVSAMNASLTERGPIGINNNIYGVKTDFASGDAKQKCDKDWSFSEKLSPRLETKEELSVENSSSWNPVRLISTNDTPDWNPVRLISSDETPDWNPVRLVSDESTSPPTARPPVHRKPAKSRPRLTAENAHALYQSPNSAVNELENAPAQEPAKPPSPLVHNLVQRYNQLSDDSCDSTPSSSRRSSVSSQNRKSWDGVKFSGENSDEKHKVSRLERQKETKERSSSDSNLMVGAF